MKKFIILIFSCLLLSSCYNKPYCEELIKQYKSTSSELWIEKEVRSKYSRNYDKIKELEKRQEDIRAELLKAHYPPKKLEKELKYY